MMPAAKRVEAIHLHARREIGDGFLRICRVTLSNSYDDGTTSARYDAEFLSRPKGLDAVVVIVWRRAADGPTREVLVREGIRPGVTFGRVDVPLAIPDEVTYVRLAEVVAGLVEPTDVGRGGLADRVCAEVLEEAGYRIEPALVHWLGAPTFASPGVLPEKHHYAAVEISPEAVQVPPAGDGSPFEDGAVTYWLTLAEAMARCERGEIVDAKTELGLFRFANWARQQNQDASL
ncbi:MAG: NUDIX hydrolase [Myxococcales bacterium]|nr:NUDIX hydrolase [Myxococcales bacterium]